MKLISVHIPKTAGVSLRGLLQRVYGQAGVAFDYADRILDPASPYHTDRLEWERRERAPLLARVEAEPAVKVIHGHFAVSKYAGLFPAARRIVWVREPVARLVSHYQYWRGLPHGGHGLHRDLLEKNLSLEEFAELPMMRDCMSRLFLDGMNLEDFDFIGRQEFFALDVMLLAQTLGWDPAALPEVGPVQNRTEDSAAALAALDARTRRRLQELNQGDTALYRQAVEIAAVRARGNLGSRMFPESGILRRAGRTD